MFEQVLFLKSREGGKTGRIYSRQHRHYSGLREICQFFCKVKKGILLLQNLHLFKMAYQKIPVCFRIRLKGLMLAGNDNFFYILHQLPRTLINTGLREFLQYKFGGHVIWMRKIDVVEPVIPQHINDELIGGEKKKNFKFSDQLMK